MYSFMVQLRHTIPTLNAHTQDHFLLNIELFSDCRAVRGTVHILIIPFDTVKMKIIYS